MSVDSQCKMILAHLKSGKSITPIDALAEYGCFRLASRICDLRQDGHNIHKEMERDERTGKRFARYSYIRSEGQNQ